MRRIIFNDNAIGWRYMDGCNEAYLKYNIDYLRNKTVGIMTVALRSLACGSGEAPTMNKFIFRR